MGYANGELGYHLWDTVKQKVIRSKDVISNESEMFKIIANDVEVKKIVDRFEEQQENIPPLKENGKPIQ